MDGWRFGRIWKKNATQINVFLLHFMWAKNNKGKRKEKPVAILGTTPRHQTKQKCDFQSLTSKQFNIANFFLID